MMKNQKTIAFVYIFSLLLVLFVLSGCSYTNYRDLAPGTVKDIASCVVSKEEVSAPTLPAEPAPPKDYRVGPGDVLLLNVAGRPEFTIAVQGAGNRVQGSRVDGAGNLHVPYLGAVPVGGLTLTQIEEKLTAQLKVYLHEPWVVVEVLEYKSLPVYLLGQFKVAGTYYMDRPITLAQGLSLGSGFDSAANLKGARLTRNGKIIPVDLYDLLVNGDTSQNVWLKGGDTIFIPDNKNQQVFVFGAVKKPGPVPMPPAGLNVAQAIASADFRDSGYDLKHVRIIRSLSTTRGQLIVVDYDKVLRGEAFPIPLVDGDIVYVPKSVFGSWNDALADLLPSLQVISNALQPFVSITYLKHNN